MTESAVAPPVFRCPMSIRYGDLDTLGHVNNVEIVAYAEDARTAFFRHLGLRGTGNPTESRVVARTEVDYYATVEWDTTPLEIAVTVVHVGTKSLRLRHEVLQHGRLCARVEAVMVGYDLDVGSSRALTPAERAVLERWLASPG